MVPETLFTSNSSAPFNPETFTSPDVGFGYTETDEEETEFDRLTTAEENYIFNNENPAQ